MSASERQQNHDLLCRAVRQAGAVALDYFRREVRSWDKAPGDPVSEADHAVDAKLKALLTAARPDYGWLSEESEDAPDRLQRQRVWIVDPIDGTRAFLRKLPEFTVCAALVEAGRPILAAVYNPATEEFFDAVQGGGARLNGTVIKVSTQAAFKGADLLCGVRMFERAGWQDARQQINFGYVNSIAYRMALVACGRYDGCLSLNPKSDWDIAAAELLVTEAGGKVTTTKGDGFVYNRAETEHPSLIIAGPAMHGLLQEFIDAAERPAGARW